MTKSVLIVGNFLSGAGGSRGVCEDLAERLAGNGWKVVAASRKRPRLLRLADMVLTAVRHRQDYSVAQLDVFSGPAFVWAETVCWTLRRLGKPYVLTLHGGNLPAFASRWPGRVKRLLSSAKAVTAPSGYLKESLEPCYREITVIPNPIDIGRYPFRGRSPARPKLVWLRAFHEIYNPVMAPRVVAALAREFPDVELSMIGPDKGDGSFERTRAEARQRGVSERIGFPGQVPKECVPKALASADVFLNTSNVDNTPVSVIEAMASGLCIVSTEVGGMGYLCENGKEALLVPIGGTEAMVSAVRTVLGEAGLSGRLSRNARAKAERFGWSAVLPEWDGLLCGLANRLPSAGKVGRLNHA
jgi:glycosyltransferase involved in cell wall biosynthesis